MISIPSRPSPAEKKLHALLHDSLDIVAILDPDGVPRHPVPAYRSVLGYDPEELVGESIFELVHPDDLPRILQKFERTLAEPEATESTEARMRHKEGGWRLLRGRGRRIEDEEDGVSVVLTTHHVSNSNPRRPTERLLVRDRDRVRIVPVAEIDWIEAEDYYARLHAAEASHLVRNSLVKLERALPARFVRIHRSAIVNLERVRELEPLGSGDYAVHLADGTELRLSRTYRGRFEEAMGRAL